MNIWKTTLLLVLLFTGITVHAQKVKISLNSDGNLTIWKVKAQAEIEHPSDMMTTRYDTRDWVKAIWEQVRCPIVPTGYWDWMR